jgi:uncharacterized protein
LELDFLSRYPQYVQLVGVGLVWISLHCAGMCGPIVIGLDLGDNLSEGAAKRKGKLLHSAGHITLYQLGRSVTYALFGALAGLGGMALQNLFREITKIAGIGMAIALLLFGILRLLTSKQSNRIDLFFEKMGLGTFLTKSAKWARNFAGFKQKFLLGVILGFLPCMITFWALGLAASTQSPLHGAIIMVMLVWMTSGVIFGFGIVPSFTPSRFHALRDRLLSVFLIFSGIWLGLVSAGANEWIGHASVGFTIAGKGYAIMFW